MFPSPFLAPIPAPPFEDWGKVPPPTECGEPLVDPTLLSPRITYGAAYLHQGLPGAEATCLVRREVARRLAEAAEKLPDGYTIHIFDSLRSLKVQKALYDQFYAVAARPPRKSWKPLLTNLWPFPSNGWTAPLPTPPAGRWT